MPLPHGRDISADQVELIIGREFPVNRFALLCNSLVWATSSSAELTQASLTERVFVQDDGIDAEWTVGLEGVVGQGALVGIGWNVFQYKQRDITGADRQQIIASLRHRLRGAAQEVVLRTQHRPDHYSLFTNVDLTHDEKKDLEHSISEGLEHPLQIRVRGAEELAAALNALPHLRSAFFSTDRFSTWHRAWASHNKGSIAGKVPELVGRSSSVAEIKAAIDDQRIRVVAITGPPGIGKNRLSLEATAHRSLDTVVALDTELGAAELLQMQSPAQSPLVIIDNPDEEQTSELIGSALGEDFKLVLTITDRSAAQQFNFGRDPRIKVFALQPLSETDSRELLRKAGATLDYSVESWVVHKAGGNAGVLIAAAAVGKELRVEGSTFVDQVGDRLEARARILLGDRGVQIIRALSTMTAVGVTGNAGQELRTICDALGGITVNDVLSNVGQFTRSGFVRQVGNYLEVIPPVLANRSAALCLAGRDAELTNLLYGLPLGGRARLLRRIQQVHGNTLRSFLQELFQRGALRDFACALQNTPLLHLLAPAAPGEAVTLIHTGLSNATVEERLAFEPGARRNLIWTIEELLFMARASAAAMRCLSLLAEAETEQFSNNATHLFEECFYPLHPQLPLPLSDRIAVLNELLVKDMTKQRKMIVIGAAVSAFNGHGICALRRSDGAEPFDAVPAMTYDEIYDYWGALISVLRQLMADRDSEIAAKAGEGLIRAVAEFTIRARPPEGLRMLEELSTAVIARTLPIRLEDYVQALNITQRGLTAQQSRFPTELVRVTQLVEGVDSGDFDTRVRRWVGTWDYGKQEQDENGSLVFRSEIEIRELARSAASNRNGVSEDLFRWLRSQEAKKASHFFFLLGRSDEAENWVEEINRAGQAKEGELAFACYYGGRASTHPNEVEDKLDELTTAGLVRAEALVGATGYLPGSGRAITRILILLRRGVDPALVERRLMGGGWMNPVSPAEAATLLRAIAGPRLEHAALVIDFLAMWVHGNKALEGDVGELAWQALESTPEGGEAWDFDLVAAALVARDLDRAFALLERFLSLPRDVKSWEPLDRHGSNRFWSSLWAADRRRCLELLLRVAAKSPLLRWRISWHLPEMLDLQEDRDLLTEFANRSAANAEFVSSCLTGSKPGFWPIATGLLALLPENRLIRGNIAMAARHMNHTIAGPMSDHLIRCAEAAEELLNKENLQSPVQAFVRQLAEDLRREAQRERQEEEDESVDWSS
jgi:hypothetical protein